MKHRPLVAILLVASALLLTSCSPATIGITGLLRHDDGTLTVLVRICRASVDSLYFTGVTSTPVLFADGKRDRDVVSHEKVRLSSRVTGAADFAMPFNEAALLPDVEYDLTASGGGGNASSATFIAEELAALKPGEVLAPRRGHRQTGAGVTPTQFEAMAEHFCS